MKQKTYCGKKNIGRIKEIPRSLGISFLPLASMFSELQYWDG